MYGILRALTVIWEIFEKKTVYGHENMFAYIIHNKSLIYCKFLVSLLIISVQHVWPVCARLSTDQVCHPVCSNLMPGCFFTPFLGGNTSTCQPHFPVDRTICDSCFLCWRKSIFTCVYYFPLCFRSNGGATSHYDQRGGPEVISVSLYPRFAAVGHIWLVACDSCDETWEVRLVC